MNITMSMISTVICGEVSNSINYMLDTWTGDYRQRNVHNIFPSFVIYFRSRTCSWLASGFGEQGVYWGVSAVFSHRVLETLLQVFCYNTMPWE